MCDKINTSAKRFGTCDIQNVCGNYANTKKAQKGAGDNDEFRTGAQNFFISAKQKHDAGGIGKPHWCNSAGAQQMGEKPKSTGCYPFNLFVQGTGNSCGLSVGNRCTEHYREHRQRHGGYNTASS